jgi:hypothetical protein
MSAVCVHLTETVCDWLPSDMHCPVVSAIITPAYDRLAANMIDERSTDSTKRVNECRLIRARR